MKALALWNKEWVSCSNGLATRLFFPDVASAAVLVERQTCALTSQILTGHCALNWHQCRFGFVSSSLCDCGLAPETVEHFLFACPRHSAARHYLEACVLAAGLSWPPQLSLIPLSAEVWKALRYYLKSTNRLSLSRLRAEVSERSSAFINSRVSSPHHHSQPFSTAIPSRSGDPVLPSTSAPALPSVLLAYPL